MLHIAPDKLQSTLGLKLPPVFTFLPCLSSRPGLLLGGQGGHHAMPCHAGTPRTQIPTPTYGTAGRSSPRIC